MAGGIELGTAYVQIVPSLRGASKSIEGQLAGIDTRRAGEKLGGGLGDSLGDAFGRSGVPKFKRTFSSALADMGGAAQRLGGQLSGIGGKLTAGFTVPLGAAAVGAGSFAMRTASSAETVEMGFETMLGSAEAARDMMGDLADFAARTPFELDGLQQSAKQMMAYGFAAEDVIPMLRSVGDATSALGSGQEGINQVTRALGQMKAKGKVSAEEMLQLTEVGIPAWEFLAEAIGTDTAGAMDAVSEGAVDASTGISALTQGMDREFGGLMEKQAKTIPGIMSNIAGSIKQPLMALKDTSAYGELADALSEVADAAGPFVKSLMPHLEKGLESVAKVVDGAADALEGFTRMSYRDQDAVIKLAAAAASAGPVLKVMGSGLTLVGTAAKGAARAMDLGKSAAAKMGAAAKGAVPLIKGLATGTEGAGAMARLAAGGMSLLKGALPIAALGLAATAIGSVVGKLKEQKEHSDLVSAATESMASMSDRAAGAVEGMGAALGGAATDAQGALQSVADLNAEYVDTMSELGSKSAELDTYVRTIEELGGKSGLTASEQQRLKSAVEGYNSITGQSVEVTDAANGALSQSKDEILKNAAAWRENAKAQAYQELATKYLKEQIDASMQLESATAELKRRQDELDAARSSGAGYFELKRLTEAVDEQQREVDDLSTSVRESGRKYGEMTGMATASMADLDSALKGALTDLPPIMQAKGTDIAVKLSEGISAGKVTADQAAEFLGSGVMAGVQALPPQMQQAGMDAALSLAGAVAAGQVSVDQAAAVLNAAATGAVSSLPENLRALGDEAARTLGSGLSLQEALVAGAGDTLRSAADAASAPLVGNMQATGTEAGASLASTLAATSGQSWASGDALRASALSGAAPVTGQLGATGANAGASLAGALSGNAGAVRGAGSTLSASAQGGVAGLTSALNSTGYGAAAGMAGGMRGGAGNVSGAAGQLSAAASHMADGNSGGWGRELGNNFAAGIRSAWGTVANAAKSIAGAVADFLHFTEPDKGPLVGINDSGYEMAQNYAAAMMRGRGLVARASNSLADAARFEGGGTVDVRASGASARAVATQPQQQAPTAEDIAAAIVCGLSRTGFRLDMDADGMALRLAPAIDRQLGYRTEMGYA